MSQRSVELQRFVNLLASAYAVRAAPPKQYVAALSSVAQRVKHFAGKVCAISAKPCLRGSESVGNW